MDTFNSLVPHHGRDVRFWPRRPSSGIQTVVEPIRGVSAELSHHWGEFPRNEGLFHHTEVSHVCGERKWRRHPHRWCDRVIRAHERRTRQAQRPFVRVTRRVCHGIPTRPVDVRPAAKRHGGHEPQRHGHVYLGAGGVRDVSDAFYGRSQQNTGEE